MKLAFAATSLLFVSMSVFAWEKTCDNSANDQRCTEHWLDIGQAPTCSAGKGTLGRACDRTTDMGYCRTLINIPGYNGGWDTFSYFPNIQCGTGDTFATCAAKFEADCINSNESVWVPGSAT
jgi:hypothetical protein